MNGLIILDKPAGLTSAQAVDRVKLLLPRGTKIGHGGTLDHFATGVLILLIGRATRQFERIMSWPKIYEATIKLGATTATDDIDSPEQPLAVSRQSSRDDIEAALKQFIGDIQQRPPLYSAIKLDGARASDRVRRGQAIDIKPRIVQVQSIDVLSYDWPLLCVRIECGRGTYIRSIARDLGAALNVGGYLKSLRRVCTGAFTDIQAVTLENLNAENIAVHLRPPDSQEQGGQQGKQAGGLGN